MTYKALGFTPTLLDTHQCTKTKTVILVYGELIYLSPMNPIIGNTGVEQDCQ